ncbi:AAA family ATPase [Cytobacillus gottheilii]|uniref:AAA family ATPase n=1 Tax=Cytobacillus gottheilii TaxID=859144 RepID=UPI0024957721|nr:AAA family ATPase [Cytobacillus gottheilii]
MERAWFVGAMIKSDQTDRFVNEGIWENGYDDKYLEQVKSIEIGDRIAIKSTYTRKHNLPFDNHNNSVSVMGIKAIGTVTHNYNDGKRIDVDWEMVNPIREWYFFTSRNTIWKVEDEKGWMYKNLIDFTFNNEEQYIDKFIEHPFWKSRYGDADELYEWTYFYEAIANAMLKYQNNRSELVKNIHNMFEKINMNNPLTEKKSDGTKEQLKDICPFTIFGLFNKGITDDNRKKIMKEIADILKVTEEVPQSFNGIPVLNNMKAWFFSSEENRKDDDIDNLWDLFRIAIDITENDTEENRNAFIEIYNKVSRQRGILWNITIALYWIRPWDYLTLDNNTRTSLSEKLNVLPEVPKKLFSSEEYLELIEQMKEKFEQVDYPVHSFPELSYKSWSGELTPYEGNPPVGVNPPRDEYEQYTKDDFLTDVFIDEEKYETIKSLLLRKKNLILQGAPGVGKTFAAKRLAYSLMGERDESRIKFIQFHQSYSYEDFIMGYRPNGTGFELKKGPFYKFCVEASKDPNRNYYFIIDEINRGNLSKIFGELLMLIESDKRGDKIMLTYSDESFFVPENVYIIGMMNTADRSLAIIDYALRRRFCFVELEPAFESDKFKNHLISQGADAELVDKIKRKMGSINMEITKDVNLGKGFRIGHSYFSNYNKANNWYEEVIKYEIEPLITEYWFDEEDKAKNYVEELLR